jgi:hypothetical protein
MEGSENRELNYYDVAEIQNWTGHWRIICDYKQFT